MAAQRAIRRPSSGRTVFKNIVRVFPALVIIAATINTVSCKNNNGLLQQTGGGGGATASGSLIPTSTPTAAAAALAFVTNFNDAQVSSFTRNTSTGALTHTGQVTAGAKHGPRGVIAAPSGNFLYVANINDDKIYEFSVNPTIGTLTPLSTPSVSNGNATAPDELAINSAGTLLWVTGRAGTVTSYTVDTATGQLTKKSSIDGFNTPFGIAVHPKLAVLYVSDLKTGLIQPMSYNTKTGALAKNFPAVASSDPNAKIPAALTIDAAGAALFTPDQGNGEVSSFAIVSAAGGSRSRNEYRQRVCVHGQLGRRLGFLIPHQQLNDHDRAGDCGVGLQRAEGIGGGSAERVRLRREQRRRHDRGVKDQRRMRQPDMCG